MVVGVVGAGEVQVVEASRGLKSRADDIEGLEALLLCEES